MSASIITADLQVCEANIDSNKERNRQFHSQSWRF